MTLKEVLDTTNPDNNLGPVLVAVGIAVVIALLVIIPHAVHH